MSCFNWSCRAFQADVAPLRMSGRRMIALVVMLPMSAAVMAAWLCDWLGRGDLAEQIDSWASPRIAELLQWVERGEL